LLLLFGLLFGLLLLQGTLVLVRQQGSTVEEMLTTLLGLSVSSFSREHLEKLVQASKRPDRYIIGRLAKTPEASTAYAIGHTRQLLLSVVVLTDPILLASST
jgi:hypothetical protein